MLKVKVRKSPCQTNTAQNDTTFSIKSSATISELQNLIYKQLGVEVAFQKLYYAGKQLHSAHKLQDYKVKNEDVIQLMLNEATKNKNPKTEISKNKFVEASSKFYKVNDLIDVIYKELGAWFEAKIINIFIEEGKEALDDNLIFEVVMDRNEQTAPIKVTFGEIRPRAHQSLQKTELQLGMVVFVNYNIQKPRDIGYWYDFQITKINDKKKCLEGTILLHGCDDNVEKCKLKFKENIMKIEKPVLLTERKMEMHKNLKPRKLPLYCKKCKDVNSVNCKDCSCCVCGVKIYFDQLIICDECERTFHLYCLNPPLVKIPSEIEWYCPDCKTNEDEIVKPGEMLKMEQILAEKAKVSNIFGSISGIDVGTIWKDKKGMLDSGIHNSMTNISSDKEGVYSLLLDGDSSIYQDTGEEFYFNLYDRRTINDVDSGLENAPDCVKHFTKNCHKSSSKDDCFGVAQKWKLGKPIRVIRGANQRSFFKFAPTTGYRYEGLYKVLEYFSETENSGNIIVWRFYLRRDDNVQPPWPDFASSGVSHNKKKKVSIELNESYLMKLIAKDDANCKMWNVLKETAKLGSAEFLDKVKEVFTCVCCNEMVKTPVTTTCKHNICYVPSKRKCNGPPLF